MLDPQVKALYEMEGQFSAMNQSGLTSLSKTALWVKWACKKYGVKPPKLYPSRIKTSYYDPNTHKLYFKKHHRNVGIALHEAAHAIVDTILGTELAPHGPHFLGVYFYLLDASGFIRYKALSALAAGFGLTYVSPKKISPRNIRKTYKGLVKKARHAAIR